MWGFLGIDKDNNDFTRKDANTFRNVAFISLGVGGFCSFIFHLMVKFEPQVETEDVSNREVSNIERDEEDLEAILSDENCDENLFSFFSGLELSMLFGAFHAQSEVH